MDLQRINVKFFGRNSSGVPLETFIHIFNSWIQASDGEYYDIADYSHLHTGPGVLLIAHEANISIDETGGRRGLLYNRKQSLQGSNQEKLHGVFRAALENCRRIEDEPSLQGKFKFTGSEALFLINDRLLAPNNEETFLAVKRDLEDLAQTVYAGAEFTLERETDPKKRFSVQLKTHVFFDIATLLKNLEKTGEKVEQRLIS
jgi:hypothetical protein